MRVLIAEDDQSVRIALRMVLADAGHEVFEASSTAEVRALLFPVIPDALIVDAGLPGDGVELWRELQASTTYRGRAILVSGDPTALRGMRSDANVFAKPFDFDALLERIRRVGTPSSGEVRGRLGQDPPGRRLPGTG